MDAELEKNADRKKKTRTTEKTLKNIPQQKTRNRLACDQRSDNTKLTMRDEHQTRQNLQKEELGVDTKNK